MTPDRIKSVPLWSQLTLADVPQIDLNAPGVEVVSVAAFDRSETTRRWSDMDNSDPFTDVAVAIAAFLKTHGRFPRFLAMGPSAFTVAAWHPDVERRIHGLGIGVDRWLGMATCVNLAPALLPFADPYAVVLVDYA